MSFNNEPKPRDGQARYDYFIDDGGYYEEEYYDGYWKNGRRNGFGMHYQVLDMPNEFTYEIEKVTIIRECYWKDDCMGDFVWETQRVERDGKIIETTYIGIPGVFYVSNGIRYSNSDEYKLEDGTVCRIEENDDKVTFIGIFDHGKRNGLGAEWIYDDQNNLIEENHGLWKDDVLVKRLDSGCLIDPDIGKEEEYSDPVFARFSQLMNEKEEKQGWSPATTMFASLHIRIDYLVSVLEKNPNITEEEFIECLKDDGETEEEVQDEPEDSYTILTNLLHKKKYSSSTVEMALENETIYDVLIYEIEENDPTEEEFIDILNSYIL